MMKTTAMKRAIAKIESAFKKSGYDNAYDFHKRSGVGVAYYTVVRMLDSSFDKPPSIPTLIEVAFYAGCKPEQIKDILISIGDEFWHKLLADPAESQSLRELALVETARTITAKDEGSWKQIADSMSLIARAAGVADKCAGSLTQLGG